MKIQKTAFSCRNVSKDGIGSPNLEDKVASQNNATFKNSLSLGGVERGWMAHCLMILTDSPIRFEVVQIRGQRTNDHSETFERLKASTVSVR